MVRVSNRLDLYQDGHSVDSDLCCDCLQILFAKIIFRLQKLLLARKESKTLFTVNLTSKAKSMITLCFLLV